MEVRMLKDITSVHSVGRHLMQKIGSLPQETCWVIGVNTQMRVVCEKQIAVGTADNVAVHPRDLFRPLVATNAFGFVVAHNHPSGNLRLSDQDIRLMQHIALCANVMQCQFLDFLVISPEGFLSQHGQRKLPTFSTDKLLELWTRLDKM
jgi:DNA repair protein RadC